MLKNNVSVIVSDSDEEVIITLVLLIEFSYKKLIKTKLLNVQLNMTVKVIFIILF